MRRIQRFAATLPVVTAFLLGTPVANAYVISIVGSPSLYGENLSVSNNGTTLSVSDSFDQYDETRWEIRSAVQTSSGGVQVTYNYPAYGHWDSYGARAGLQFQILAEPGDLDPTSVTVDLSGSTFYDWDSFYGCCFSDAPDLWLYAPNSFSREYVDYDGSHDVISESVVLSTNTSYFIEYYTTQYVEGVPSESGLPHYFSSWAAYDSFVASRGTSGTVYTSAFGFMDFNLTLAPSSVPEPGTLALLGAGLAGIGVVGRRRRTR
jgi:hypothetical protein